MKKTKKSESSVILDDKSVIDLESYDWGKEKLNNMQKLFIFWYTYPGGDCYHKLARAARKAGYSDKTASQKSYDFLKNEAISKKIKEFDDSYVKTGISDAYHRIIKRKIARVDFNTTDFYNFNEFIDDNGNKKVFVSIKKPDELEEYQKICIDAIDFQGQNSIPNYKLPNRKQEEDTIIDLYDKINGIKNSDDYDVESTAEIIKGKLSLTTKIIKKNEKIAQKASQKYKKECDSSHEED
ncbi:MAG: hypothetical protein ACRC4W_02325 [Treponemataceae bacterium]